MTSEKLTAKLSDGTEWKVVSNEPTAKGSENRVVWLMPLKPSPPKEVLVRIYSDGTVGHAFAKEQFPEDDNTCTHHRYTLAPEPKCMNCDKEMERIGESSKNYFCRHCVVPEDPKPAREWWDVRYVESGHPFCSYTESIDAKKLVDRENTISGRHKYEVVHVREVVE